MQIQPLFDHGDGWWVNEDRRLPSSKSSAFSKSPRMIVLHWDAAPKKTLEENLARIKKLANNTGDKKSSHFFILRDGSIWQMIPTTRAAWHAGDSRWTCADGTSSKKSVNLFSIGIDFDNVGPLTLKNGVFYDCYGGKYDGVGKSAQGKWFDPPTDDQMIACRLLLECLRTKFKIELQDIVGHLDVSPGRKIDPGPFVTRTTLGME